MLKAHKEKLDLCFIFKGIHQLNQQYPITAPNSVDGG
jgi:hypothetical protein